MDRHGNSVTSLDSAIYMEQSQGEWSQINYKPYYGKKKSIPSINSYINFATP